MADGHLGVGGRLATGPSDELVRAVAQVTGGSGGGKPHLALAGGKDAGKLEAALAEARARLTAALGG